MQNSTISPRLRGLQTARIGGIEVPVVVGPRARLLGLAHLDREEAGPGLLIPRCRSVHTFGMRFDLDLVFLGDDGLPVGERHGVGPRRVVGERLAVAVLELPAPSGHFVELLLERGETR